MIVLLITIQILIIAMILIMMIAFVIFIIMMLVVTISIVFSSVLIIIEFCVCGFVEGSNGTRFFKASFK
jgi:hypothetical protein